VPKKSKLPQEIVDLWPEVFDGIEVIAVPVEYISHFQVHLEDGRTYEIGVEKMKDDQILSDSVEEVLGEFFEEFDEEIVDIEFQLNADKVIEDARGITSKITSNK